MVRVFYPLRLGFSKMLFSVLFCLSFAAVVTSVCGQNNNTSCPLNSICFALDQSGSIRPDYDEVVEFTVRVATTISRRSSQVMYSAQAFSSSTSLIQAPTTDLAGTFIPAIENNSPSGGGTNIFGGVRACFETLQRGGSGPNSNRVIVVVTDGQNGGGDSNPRSEIIAAGMSIVTVGIGSGVDEDFLRALASQPRFFVPSASDDLVANSVVVANAACRVVTVSPRPESTPDATVSPLPVTTTPPISSACQRAYDACDFRFVSYPSTVPTFSLSSTPADTAFTTRIVSRTNPAIGVLNANEVVPEFIFLRGNAFPISNFGSPPFTPTHFKPFSLRNHQFASGIGHQSFTGNQRMFAKNRCIRIYFSDYQTINVSGSTPQVIENVSAGRADNKCVVFQTS